MGGLDAAVVVLREEARRWQAEMAETMRGAADVANALHVTPQQLTWASDQTGLAATYEEIRTKAARVLSEGAANFEAVSLALRRAADAYDGVEVENAEALRRAWQHKDR
jgi:hypothetical protein